MAASDLHKKLLAKGIPPPYPNPAGGLGLSLADKKPHTGRKNYSPLPWNEYFDEKKCVKIKSGTENDENAENLFNVYIKGNSGPVLFMLHGGGYSGLTWALFAKYVVKMIHCQVVALDSRGHGETKTTNDEDLSAETQARDVENVVNSLFESDPPPMFFIGHSMGGAIAVHVASRNLLPSLIGLAVIDVVEGSAMDALNSMQNVLRGRPASFKSMETAIEWCVRSGQVRNLESARVSMPGQITKWSSDFQSFADGANTFSEIDEADENKDQSPLEAGDRDPDPSKIQAENYVWRVNLSKSEPFWQGWFRGLSQMFLGVQAAKLLILAGVDRLDKDLTVGQMQGKFQMMVLPKVGHAVHEDSPDRVAETIASFMVRNKFVEPIAEIAPVYPGC